MQECLQRMPLAIDAAIALAELGLPYSTIIELCPVIAKSNLQRANVVGKSVASVPHSAEPVCCGGVDRRVASQTCARRSSHSGALLHSPQIEAPTPVCLRQNTAANNAPSHELQNTSGKFARTVQWLNVAQQCAADEVLLRREPMVERSLSPTDTWLSCYKEHKSWQPDDSLQLVHMQDEEQLRPPDMLLHAPAQQRPACNRLNLKSGLPAVQQAVDTPAALVGIRVSKRRKLIAVRLPLLEQEQDAPNSGAMRDSVGPGMKRNQPDADMAAVDGLAEGRPVKPPSSNVPKAAKEPLEAAGFCKCQSGNVLMRAVSQVGESERCEILQRQGLGWLGLVVAGHAHLFRAANREAVREFSAAAALFPNDVTSMLSAAIALLAAGDHVGAISTFQRARVLDPLNVRGMDAYACLLLDQDNHEELRTLSHGLLAVDLEMPEVWAVMAYFWLQKSESDKALEYVERYVIRSSVALQARRTCTAVPQYWCCRMQGLETRQGPCWPASSKGPLPVA